VPHLPAAGEIVLFDRSWYNRAGVERVMGFCQRGQTSRSSSATVPEFERMLVRSGIILVKYWFSITRRGAAVPLPDAHPRPDQAVEAVARWTSQSRVRWEEYTKAKEAMLARTATSREAPVVGRRGRRQEAGAG
jgi:polyphosphate kinase